jgi:hypothetical protein
VAKNAKINCQFDLHPRQKADTNLPVWPMGSSEFVG